MAVAKTRAHTDKFSVLINNAGYQNLRSYAIIDNSVLRFEFVVVARQSDGSNRAVFRRVGMFYRQAGGPVQIHGLTWETPETHKSDPNMDVKYVLSLGSISIQVHNAGSVGTRWAGYVNITSVK